MLTLPKAIKKSCLGAVACATLLLAVGSAQAADHVPDRTCRRRSTAASNISPLRRIQQSEFGGRCFRPCRCWRCSKSERAAIPPTRPRATAAPTRPTRRGCTLPPRTSSTALNETDFYAYRDGHWMFALAEYALTGGPDKSVLAPGNADYQTIKQAMDTLVDRTLANQRKAPASECHRPRVTGATTGRGAKIRRRRSSSWPAWPRPRPSTRRPRARDQAFADPAQVTAIDAALALAKTAYELNARHGSDNRELGVTSLTPTERGHGYNAQLGYNAVAAADGLGHLHPAVRRLERQHADGAALHGVAAQPLSLAGSGQPRQ